MWLAFALLAPLFFAAVHTIDAYCVEELLNKPWMGAITSSIATIVVIFVPLPYLLPFIEFDIPSTHILLLGLTAGLLIQLSQILYFQSLSYSEAGIVAAYWNMIPAILPALSFVLFGHVLATQQYIGIALLIFASTCMLILDSTLRSRIHTFLLMLAACLFQALAYLAQDAVFEEINFFSGFHLLSIGLIAGGLLPLAFQHVRREIYSNRKKILLAGKLFVLVEFINVIALICAQRAISLGDPSLVAAIETTIPAFTFINALLLLAYTKTLGDPRTKHKIHWKFGCIALMAIGVFLVSQTTSALPSV